MKSFVARNPVTTFVLLTLGLQFAIVAYVWFVLPPGGHLHEDPHLHMLFRFRVFGPLAACVGITWWLEGMAGIRNLFGSFLVWKVPGKWYLAAGIWKFLFAYLGIGVVIVALGKWPGVGLMMPRFWDGWLVTLPFIFGIAFVEETSWMKFCLTRLQMRYSALVSTLIIGNCWGMWYLPMVAINEGVPPGYPILVFHGCMISLTILLAWLYNNTHSGVVLMLAQVVSNTAFFITPILPPNNEITSEVPTIVAPEHYSGLLLDVDYVTLFSLIFIAASVLIVFFAGGKDLGPRPRARWDEGMGLAGKS
ncbi:MAG: hypothetical protein IT229_10435 [Flavobacteriales bacterium]|nr:hypothetical protein [Flavobacteriales bacterium]